MAPFLILRNLKLESELSHRLAELSE